MNRALTSLHEGLLKLTLTTPLTFVGCTSSNNWTWIQGADRGEPAHGQT